MTATVDLDGILRVYDQFNAEHTDNRWELLAHARSHCPVPFSESYGGQYHVTRYEDLRFVCENPEIFSSAVPATTNEAPVRLPPLDADPPLQQEFRKILNPFLSRSYLLKFEPQMRQIANDAIDAWIDRGRCEFIGEFAIPYSSGVLATVVFDETDPDRVARARDCTTRIAIKADAESFFGLAMLAAEYLSERDESLGDRDDILGAVARGTLLGREMTEDERLGVITVLFLGGLDTTRGALGTIAHQMATIPGIEDRLRTPGWARQDLDELLRRFSPVALMARTAVRDVELGGTQLRVGDRLVLHFESANRDETRFERPDELLFEARRPGNALFGLGIHRCVGSHLARLQIEVAYEVLLSRITNLRVVEEDVRYASGAALGPEDLKLEFDRL